MALPELAKTGPGSSENDLETASVCCVVQPGLTVHRLLLTAHYFLTHVPPAL